MTVRAENVPGAGRVRITLSMWNRKNTCFGIMEREGKHAHWASGRWWLEQRDDLAKYFTKFLITTYQCVQVVVPKSSMVPTVNSLLTTSWLDFGLNYCEWQWVPWWDTYTNKKTFGKLYLTQTWLYLTFHFYRASPIRMVQVSYDSMPINWSICFQVVLLHMQMQKKKGKDYNLLQLIILYK